MARDKHSAVWVSHSSISDYLQCSRCYYLKNIYRDPKTGHKIQLITPALSLGQAVHNVIESLSFIPTEKRFEESLLDKYEKVWQNLTGKRGGFTNEAIEHKYKERGAQMLRNVMLNPGPLLNLAVKVKAEGNLPRFWLSDELNIILCGKIDWLEYVPESDSVHIIDFKTSTKVEDGNSLQLPIYSLLVHNTQKREVSKISYWYLELHDHLTPKELPNLEQAFEDILTVAKKIKLARQLGKFECAKGGCYACKPFEMIVEGKAELVGTSEYNQDVYVIPQEEEVDMESDLI